MVDRTKYSVDSWAADMLKIELYQLIKLHKPAPKYVNDDMALEHGFVVVHLPPYHCVLNPFELILAWVKTTVAKKTTHSRSPT